MDKEHLHEELVRVVSRPERYWLRVVGHALIDLGRVTAVECGWDDCIMPSREFVPDSTDDWHPQHRMGVSVDHVVGRQDSGDDRPENIMLLHFGCNSAKGQRERFSDPQRAAAHSEKLRERWADPAYREKMSQSLSEAGKRPDVAARKSESMKKTVAEKPEGWAREKAQRAAETRRRRAEERGYWK